MMKQEQIREHDKNILDAKDIAAMIGVAPRTVYQWTKKGRIPCIKIGHTTKFRADEIKDWLEESHRPANNVDAAEDRNHA